jgi:fumarylpyruvate hydrolase
MQNAIFTPPQTPTIPITGSGLTFPVRRIFCVGRNYAAHAAEMGNQVDRDAPFYFTKSAFALCPSGSSIPMPPGTEDCHFEMEFVVALGAPVFAVDESAAMQAVFGYGCGIDLTRRDLQSAAKEKRRPWDLGKDFENAAVIAPLTKTAEFGDIKDQTIRLLQNGEPRQNARLSDMIWPVPALISHLSRFYHLAPGDLIYTGTPAGVGPIHPGDTLRGEIDGLTPLDLTINA